MSNQFNLLAQVRQYLILNNEDYEWITMGDDHQRIGLAYLPTAETGLPCTFMFTELEEPATLVFDAHFALRVIPEERQELSMLLLTLNANITEGRLLLDLEGGFVYFRMNYTPTSETASPEAIHEMIQKMETLGISMCQTYARIISQEFTTY